MPKIIGVSGHRETGDYTLLDMVRSARHSLEWIREQYGLWHVVIGGQRGWDIAVGVACRDLEIGYHVAISFDMKVFIKGWSAMELLHFQLIWDGADHRHIVCPGGYAAWKHMRRNEAIIAASEAMLVLWDGRQRGGTYNAIKYSEKQKRPIWNAYKHMEAQRVG